MKFVVFSLGCKVNQYEGQSMIKGLEARGFEAVDSLEFADCYIINTCSVTAEADKKSRQAVSRVLKLNPDAKVVICGCSAQNDYRPYQNKPNVSIIGGTSGKMALLDSIMSGIVGLNSVKEPPLSYEDDLFGELTKTRGFIKVQDGCNNFCSYCIVPYLRGRSRSRSLDSIVSEAEEMALKTHEIVITGINVSDYGSDISLNLLDLIKALNHIPVRKRFGSLECGVLDENVLSSMAEVGWCDSFHLSMQSGSDRILKKMNRRCNTTRNIQIRSSQQQSGHSIKNTQSGQSEQFPSRYPQIVPPDNQPKPQYQSRNTEPIKHYRIHTDPITNRRKCKKRNQTECCRGNYPIY